MGDALGTVGQAGSNTLTGLHDTGAGIRDFLAGPGSAQQPIVQQVLGSLLGAMVFDQAPGLLAKMNADKQGRIDAEQGQLEQYLGLPAGREALGTGARDSLQALFPHATLPRSIPVEAGPVPAGMNAVATGPSGGPTTGAFILPMSAEQRAVARTKALLDAQQAAFPIGQYQAPGAQFQISEGGNVEVQSQVKARPDTEMLVPTDEIDAENLTTQGLSAIETRFADARGVPLVLLQHDKAAEAARIQAAKTAVVEASQLRRIAASGAEARKTVQTREDLVTARPPKAPTPKVTSATQRIARFKLRLLEKKRAGRPFTPQESELYDVLIARPRPQGGDAALVGALLRDDATAGPTAVPAPTSTPANLAVEELRRRGVLR